MVFYGHLDNTFGLYSLTPGSVQAVNSDTPLSVSPGLAVLFRPFVLTTPFCTSWVRGAPQALQNRTITFLGF